MTTAREAIAASLRLLTAITDTPRLDAELLMAHALGVDRNALLLRHLDDGVPAAYGGLIKRRLAREPIAYITGMREFWSLNLAVTPDVLIPRPDSETLIECAIEHFKGLTPQRILDLGTGSGALLLAALSVWPDALGTGIDASKAALAVAQSNADRLGFADRAQFLHGDWATGLNGPFDLILCNPPYVELAANLTPEVMNEPHGALFAGKHGLDDYVALAPQIGPLLAPGGCAVMEIGATQAASAGALFAAELLKVDVRQDLSGQDRCLVLTQIC
jgi:release factor glutamine methyltransferase